VTAYPISSDCRCGGAGLTCPLPSPWSRLIPSQRDQLVLRPKPPGRLLSALHTAPPGKASWGTRPLSLEAVMPPGKGLQAVLPDIFVVLAVRGLRCCAWAFSSCGEQGLLSRCRVRASHCGVFCRTWAIGTRLQQSPLEGSRARESQQKDLHDATELLCAPTKTQHSRINKYSSKNVYWINTKIKYIAKKRLQPGLDFSWMCELGVKAPLEFSN